MIKGYIQSYDGETLTIAAPFSNDYLLSKQGITECEIRLNDGRKLTTKQRNAIFSIVSDITDYVSQPPETERKREEIKVLRELKILYLIDITDKEEMRRILTRRYCDLSDTDLFSLSNCDMTTALEFLHWLIELCVVHGIPCHESLLSKCEDVGRYLYACVANRRCAICGAKADIHEVEKVGAGRNRRKIHHLGQLVQPLCRKHHSEVEQIGQQSFDKKYHLEAIRLDEELCKILKWKV